ncbi:MAG: nitrous oxide reductase family maturation protein NosD [Candidatus Hermodarchaeota archaeon]
MKRKTILVLGLIVFSMILFIQPIRAENGLIEVDPFVINGNLGWYNLSISQSWCSGNGTVNNPYIIENIEIEHTDYDYFTNGLEHCLKIDGSNVFFIIKDCIFHGAGRMPIKKEDGSWIVGYGGNGIWVRNSSNGLIINNICYDNVQNNGIEIWYYSNNIIVKNNTCFNNGDYGIYVGAYCENIIIQENNIGINTDCGISIWRSDNNQIINNSLIGNYGRTGIYLRDHSNYNIIKGNLIDHSETGMELEISDFNNITDNIVHYYQYSIKEMGVNGHYCEGNIIENNTLIFDDFVPPSIHIREPQENQIFNTTSPAFNLYIVERLSSGIVSQWYTLDNGITNYTFSLINFKTGTDSYGEYISADGIDVINQEAWNNLEKGLITIIFYVRDGKGNVACKDLIVIKDVEPEPPEPPDYISYIIGFSILVSFIIIGFIGRFISKRKTKF